MKTILLALLLIFTFVACKTEQTCEERVTRLRGLWRWVPDVVRDELRKNLVETIDPLVPSNPAQIEKTLRDIENPRVPAADACAQFIERISNPISDLGDCIYNCGDSTFNLERAIKAVAKCRLDRSCYVEEVKLAFLDFSLCIEKCQPLTSALYLLKKIEQTKEVSCEENLSRFRALWKWVPEAVKDETRKGLLDVIDPLVPANVAELEKVLRNLENPRVPAADACKALVETIVDPIRETGECVYKCGKAQFSLEKVAKVVAKCRLEKECYLNELKVVLGDFAKCAESCKTSEMKKKEQSCEDRVARLRTVWRWVPAFVQDEVRKNLVDVIKPLVPANHGQIEKVLRDIENPRVPAADACKAFVKTIVEPIRRTGDCVYKCGEENFNLERIAVVVARCRLDRACFEKEIRETFLDFSLCADKCQNL